MFPLVKKTKFVNNNSQILYFSYIYENNEKGENNDNDTFMLTMSNKNVSICGQNIIYKQDIG